MNADILAVNDLFVLTSRSAEIAMKLVAAAIDTISEHRSDLGANQNRLEHSYNNVTNEMENVQASESRIRDTDMAEEMTEYAKHKILMQTGQAMLMQTNQNNSTILKLLQWQWEFYYIDFFDKLWHNTRRVYKIFINSKLFS